MLLDSSKAESNMPRDGEQDQSVPAAITDTGCERELNEDRYAVIESPSGLAWFVCDGMGGSAGGELAAQLAIDALRRDLENMPPRLPEQALREALLEANRVIVLRRQNQAFAGMGTTVVGALFQGPQVLIGHVGDSRAYLVRDGAIQLLTTDHTYVQELVNKGQIRTEDALSHPQAHILTRAIGAEPALEVDMQKFWLWEQEGGESQDFLLLCSDGLYSLVGEGEIADVVSRESPQRACVQLVELAKSRGGFDNISLAVIPLGGQLRNDPPEGFSEDAFVRKLREKKREPESRGGMLRTFLMVFMLSALALLMAVLGMALVLSK